MDTVNYMRIASLVSGPKTQLINIMTNGYMTAVRPMERILGSVPGAIAGNGSSRALIKENLRQYTYNRLNVWRNEWKTMPGSLMPMTLRR